MKKLILLLAFFILTPLTMGVSLVTLAQISSENQAEVLGAQKTFPAQLYAALPPEVSSVTGQVTGDDARPVIIDQYLEKHNSPMAPHADFLFEMSQKYELDYRLMVAIAQCESNLCKKSPEGSFNCWGFENGATKFLSWQQAIEQVAKTLKEGYYDQGLITPEEIMPKYAPPAMENGGSWAKCVNQFFEELE